MKEIIKGLKRRFLYWWVRLMMPVLILFNVGMLNAGYRYENNYLVIYKGNGITITSNHLWITLLLLDIAIFLYCHIRLVMGRSNKIIRKPHKVNLGIHDKNKIFCILNNNLQLEKMAEECWYAEEGLIIWYLFASWKMRLFVFNFEGDESHDCFEIADEYVNKINEMTNFKPTPRLRTNWSTFRNQIFIYDKVPAEILKAAQDNVERDNWRDDILTNFFIDLSEGVLYVPFFRPEDEAGVRDTAYLFAIKQVGRYLDIL